MDRGENRRVRTDGEGERQDHHRRPGFTLQYAHRISQVCRRADLMAPVRCSNASANRNARFQPVGFRVVRFEHLERSGTFKTLTGKGSSGYASRYQVTQIARDGGLSLGTPGVPRLRWGYAWALQSRAGSAGVRALESLGDLRDEEGVGELVVADRRGDQLRALQLQGLCLGR